ncbi:type II toxin-antitoxin system VapC family toxin [Halomicronema sp. CCY15110]|uniref:type II toxin-antitoxin system VapC family toxin n=1 Tax=Halomicronema sp. CCY15110 TaxID=2767773 RepID=UPI0019507E0A|nr:type II toxin-antitoxin system VapC family toxin [Halomicronema sp. CCY15110]
MSGTKLLLDTNFVIGLLKANETVQQVLRDRPISIQDCSYSFITRIELLGFPAITAAEIESIAKLLSAMNYVPMSPAIEDATIQIRRQYGLKTPDAIIAATASVHHLELLTLDQQLANRMAEISSK